MRLSTFGVFVLTVHNIAIPGETFVLTVHNIAIPGEIFVLTVHNKILQPSLHQAIMDYKD